MVDPEKQSIDCSKAMNGPQPIVACGTVWQAWNEYRLWSLLNIWSGKCAYKNGKILHEKCKAGKFNTFLVRVLAGFKKSKFPHGKTLYLGIYDPVNTVWCFLQAGHLKWGRIQWIACLLQMCDHIHLLSRGQFTSPVQHHMGNPRYHVEISRQLLVCCDINSNDWDLSNYVSSCMFQTYLNKIYKPSDFLSFQGANPKGR